MIQEKVKRFPGFEFQKAELGTRLASKNIIRSFFK